MLSYPWHSCSSSWLLVSHFTWVQCHVLLPLLLSGPAARLLLQVASEQENSHTLTSSQHPGVTPVPALLTSTQTQLLQYPQQTPEHLAHPLQPSAAPSAPRHRAGDAAAPWLLLPHPPTHLQEVAFPQLCQSDLPRPGAIDCVEYPLDNLQQINTALEINS